MQNHEYHYPIIIQVFSSLYSETYFFSRCGELWLIWHKVYRFFFLFARTQKRTWTTAMKKKNIYYRIWTVWILNRRFKINVIRSTINRNQTRWWTNWTEKYTVRICFSHEYFELIMIIIVVLPCCMYGYSFFLDSLFFSLFYFIRRGNDQYVKLLVKCEFIRRLFRWFFLLNLFSVWFLLVSFLFHFIWFLFYITLTFRTCIKFNLVEFL